MSATLGSNFAIDYGIHYVEYDSQIVVKGGGNNFILFSETNISNSVLSKNKINAKKYDKT